MSSQSEKYVKELRMAIERERLSESEKLFQKGLADDASGFIATMRKYGVLRCSSYSFKTKIVLNILRSTSSQIQSLTPEIRAYLTSVEALYYVASTLRQVYKNFVGNLNTQSFKSYLATVDTLFWFPEYEVHNRSILRGYMGFAIEDIATAFSFYYFHLTDKGHFNDANLNHVYENKIREKYYLNRLIDLARIGKYREAEVLVDTFNYRAERKQNIVRIIPPYERFEQSMRLGYIHFQQQMIADSAKFEKSQNAAPLQAFCDLLVDKLGDIVFVEEKTPIHRITMRLPSLEIIQQYITGDRIFQEEIHQLAAIQKELLIKTEQILDIPIAGNLTIFDILKFQRFFRFLYNSFKKYIESRNMQTDPLYYRSMIPVYSDVNLTQALATLFGTDKATQLIRTFSWEHNSNGVFDVQTQPLITCGNRFLIPLGILSESNLVRNILVNNRFRFDSDSDKDPVGDELETVLLKVTSAVKRNLSYQFMGVKGDVDVIAVIDNEVFAFECKNSIHPCSTFELRTTYDYILKAAKQLSQLQKLLLDHSFREYISGKTSISADKLQGIHTCIVTGNRMFSGLNVSGHAVRPLHELCNIISTGVVIMHSTNSDSQLNARSMEIQLWQGDQFGPDDLIEYIEKDALHKARFDAMIQWSDTLDIVNKKLIFETYLIDPVKSIAIYRERFKCRIVEEQDAQNNKEALS